MASAYAMGNARLVDLIIARKRTSLVHAGYRNSCRNLLAHTIAGACEELILMLNFMVPRPTTHSTGARVSFSFVVNSPLSALCARPVNSGVMLLT
jgi:hypothetical protein